MNAMEEKKNSDERDHREPWFRDVCEEKTNQNRQKRVLGDEEKENKEACFVVLHKVWFPLNIFWFI